MSVSLVLLRLEVEDSCDAVPVLHYEAEQYLAYTKENDQIPELKDLSLTLKSEIVIVPQYFKDIPSLHQGKREYREILIQTYYPVMETCETSVNKEDLCGEQRNELNELSEQNLDETCERMSSDSSDTTGMAKTPLTIHYFSGNPSVEVTRGIMHLYKDRFISPFDSNTPRSEMVCILGVPAKCTCQDLQKYIAPAKDTILQIKIIRDSSPNQYMILIKFKDQVSADIFYQEYNGKPYNMLESEISQLVYVSKVEAIKSSEGGYLPVTNLTELPTCPVCLERMDESVAGILTVLCNHSFHNDCLMKWQDICCPVCRYCQTPEPTAEHTCFECDSSESLWICVICGHIGCGRYQEQHAYQHYQQTAHTFSMHLGNQRVWDYAGDNYVHRLIQSKGDGKVVSLDNREEVDNEKMDSLTLEYTYLLTNQLESQRLYFEEKIGFLENDAYEKISLMEASIHKTGQECRLLERKFLDCEKERKLIEKKYENVVAKAASMAKELKDEKQMNICLRENQAMWQQKVDDLETQYNELDERKSNEIAELRSEVSDLIKHLEVQCAIGNAEQGIKDDIQGGHVFMDQTSPSSSPSKGARSRTKNRKR